MRSDRSFNRGAWLLLLLATVAFVATDFVRHPFEGVQPGIAAAPSHGLTLWIPGTDADSAPASVTAAAARALNRRGAPVSSHVVPGGSASAIVALLDADRGFDNALLAVNTGTLADLERDEHGPALPGTPEQAARAATLLREAKPVALLADDTLVLVTDSQSHVHSLGQVITSLRRNPGHLVFGIGIDAWSRTALGAFVDAVHAPGHVPYRVLPSGSAAAISTGGDSADVVVAPRAELRSSAVLRRLRILAQSDAGPALRDGSGAVPRLGDVLGREAPISDAHRWIALVAPPSTTAAEVRALAARIRTMTEQPSWHATLRTLGLGEPPHVAVGPFIARAERGDRALARAASHVAQAAPDER